MKHYLAILSFFCLSYTSVAQGKIDVTHYRYSIELNDKNDTIVGQARISFKAMGTMDEVAFDLTYAFDDNKGMVVTNVSCYAGTALLSSSSPTKQYDRGSLWIALPRTLKPGDSLDVLINYKGIPADGLIISKNKYGHRTFFSDNWPNRAHNWLPCVDDPADKASVEFIVTAPSHYQVVSNGIQIEETNLPGDKKLTHWKEDVPLPTKIMVIGVADFAVNTVGNVNNCIPVSSWVFPENKKEGFYDYAQAADILAWYINYIGPYAYKKLANVQSKTIFGGMENASAIFYYENSVTGNRKEEALLAHEIVHQWFGNSATEKSFAHLWLSEGFATYLTHVYLESKYGTDSLEKRMRKDRDEVIDFVKQSSKPVVDNDNDYMQLLNANSYQKGGWILHMLRRQIGDSVFKKSVRQYYASFAGKNADTKDLQRVFETVSDKNLEQFFKQWLYTPANPSLKITWKYLAKEKQLSVTVQQLQTGDPFHFPLEMELALPNKRKMNTSVNVNAALQTFKISVNEKPAAIKADPKTSLLFEGKVTEIN